jgi:ribA/ribD-fused uncharacterized protein
MIDSFKNEYDFLSTFYYVLLTYESIMYESVEHAYQASKSFDDKYRKMIASIPGRKAGLAKMRGQNVKLRPDWEKVKVNIMKKLLYKKFMYAHMKNLLLQTQDKYLKEGNYHHDNFWGDCKCKKCVNIPGQNMLGKLLMEIRKEILEDKT